MKWNKFRLKTTTEAEDIVSSMLADLGIEGVEIEDKIPLTESDKEQMFVDILPEIEPDDGVAYLSFYLEEEADTEAVLANVKKELEEMSAYVNVGECTIEESETEDVDWVNNWKKYFHQFYVDDILIIPSWEDVKPSDEDKMVIHIDPGTAFGTGMHETTQLCIRQIRKYVTEKTKILDVGCGSGILGMLALKFGAEHSVGTDLDPCAIDATYENMENNGISRDKYEVMIGNIIDDKAVQDKVGYECYDIVAANILAPVLVELTPVIVNQLKPGGIYITSGIIDDKEETVKEAVAKAGLELIDVTYQGEWVCVTARKNGIKKKISKKGEWNAVIFLADRSWVQGDKIRLEGSDVNHMKNVLRMKEGEEVQVSDGTGNAYLCQIEGYEGDQAVLKIREKTEKDTELPSKIWLFQGLPKGDKMELIVQKAVELGVYGIVPFAAKRSVVRLDEKKAGKKQIRWQAIAKGAAEQSGRGLIPEVEIVKTYAEALEFAKELDVILVPYELEEGMKATMSIIEAIRPGQSVGIFIGPEGGFEEQEIGQARNAGAVPVTLGRRILRTETAGITTLSILMYHLECAEVQ